MTTVNLNIIILILTMLTLSCAAQVPEDDKTLSPYFFVQSDDDTDQLPLKSTSAIVNIAGVIADVEIIQEYKNEGKNPIEAIYVFPASTRAAVYHMEMTIGERVIIAKIEEKAKARQDYELAKQEGKSASLLEQQRPNVFQMNVANIMPGDLIKVSLKYTELLIPENGTYEFAYPTVVGPRYSNHTESERPSDKWINNPYLKEGVAPLYSFDIKVSIKAGMPIASVQSSSHNVDIKYTNENTASIKLSPEDQNKGNKDFILQYQLSGKQIETGVLLYEGKDENFFLAMVQPPKEIQKADIPPREYIFILDVSGSMNGFPLDISKKLMKDLLSNLRPIDKFNVMLFAGASELFYENSIPTTPENIKSALGNFNNRQGGGSTQLLPALEKALKMEGTEDYSRTFVILTDGYVSIEKEAFDLIRNNLNKANFFSFGIGSSVNRFLIEGLAHTGKGLPFVVTNPGEGKSQAANFKNYIEKPVLTNIEYKLDGFETYDVEPALLPDLFGERPILLYGKYRKNPSGKIKIEGKGGKGSFYKEINFSEYSPNKANVALKYLWAREKIRLLDDYNNLSGDEQHVKEITNLGLTYNLLTNYTSFLAIDSEIRNKDENSTTISQPLPLPEGVSNYAIGGALKMSRKYYSGTGNAVVSEISFDMEVDEEESEAMPFMVVEEQAQFNASVDLVQFLKTNIKYPEEAKENGISGTVFVEFEIDVDGTIKNIKIIRGVHKLLDDEAIRIIKLTNKQWTPAKQRGKYVKTKMTIPIRFLL